MESLSDAVGLSVPALKLLLGVLAAYPLAFGYRFLNNQSLKHLWNGIGGLWMAWFCYGTEKGGIYHSLGSIALTYLVLLVVPSRKLGLQLAFVGNLAHLFTSYFLFSTEGYDVDFTTAQCVLTLRLIGFAFDYFDGSKSEKELEGLPDQKANGLKRLPSPFEFFGYTYFYGGFLTGPQFTFKHYQRFVTEELFRDPIKKDEKEKVIIPSSILPALKVFGLGIIYLAIYTVGSGYYPSSNLVNADYLNQISLFERILTIWFCCKFALMKYVGIWLLVEGACTLAGINYNGYEKNGTVRWDALTNVKPYEFETCLTLHGLVETFNINTNDWMKRYCFKRLRFLGNKQLSQLITLGFLAVWHGFYIGYLLCFVLELVDFEAEGRVRQWTAPLAKFISDKKPLLWTYNAVCWVVRTSALHYGLVSFQAKTLAATIDIYKSVYFIGHVAAFGILLLHPLVRPARQPRKEL